MQDHVDAELIKMKKVLMLIKITEGIREKIAILAVGAKRGTEFEDPEFAKMAYDHYKKLLIEYNKKIGALSKEILNIKSID